MSCVYMLSISYFIANKFMYLPIFICNNLYLMEDPAQWISWVFLAPWASDYNYRPELK
jgi:hypothetical protein